MAGRGHDGAERDAEDTDELLYTDLDDNSSGFGPDTPPLKLDHCDLLLDAIDAQLGQLQVQPQKHQAISREGDSSKAGPLGCSQSLSKDTGLGSTTQTNDTPMSCLDLIHTPMIEQTSVQQDIRTKLLLYTKAPHLSSSIATERSTGCHESSVSHEGTRQKSHRKTRDKEEIESHREQVIWRLKRLLGDTCNEGRMAGETHPPSDSICTEDFARRFRDEMVDLALPKSNMQQLDKEDEAERTAISDCEACQSEQKGQNIFNVNRRGAATTGENNKDTGAARYSPSNKPCQRKKLEKCLFDNYGVNTSHVSEKAGAGERYNTPQRLGDDGSMSHRTEAISEHEAQRQNNSRSPKARCLAGVPVWSFDTVSIDSDLDSVSTEQVRRHIHRQPGWRSLFQSVTGMDDYCTNQSDYDIPTQEESEPESTSGQRSSRGNVLNRRPSARKAQRNKRETYRLACLGDYDKDTDEEMNHRSRKCRSEKTSEKLQSDWAKMKERLSTLRQECEKEEETLQLKKMQLKDVKVSLCELQQRRKHAFQELHRMTVETAKMEKEKKTLEFVLRDSRAEKDALSSQLHELQRQRDSCILEVRDMEEDLTALSQYKQTLKEEAFTERPSVVMSVLEREEMDRQLDSAKSELFAEQRRAREKLESMQEKLEQTREELQTATEAESTLRNRCAHLEEKQRQKKDQIAALEVQVGELQGELGQCKVREAQRELKLLDLQKQGMALQAERDELKGEIQHLKTQHCNTLKEAQEQAHKVMKAALKQQKTDLALAYEQQIKKVNKQTEEEKADALKEQALSLTQHIESLKSSLQLKGEEAEKLRDSLQQQKEKAKKREEELRVEALEKVQKAVEEERKKLEAEKVEAVQVHCGILEEQNRKSLESMRSEMQQEKSKALALQHKVLELKTRVQDLENERCTQQREQESVVAAICKSQKEEHQAELQKLRRQMTQESQRAVLRLEQANQLAEKEAAGLRVMIEERESRHNQITAEMEQQLRHWAQELGTECQHLHLLLEQSGTKPSSVQLPPRPSVAEALSNLRTLTGQLKHLIIHQHQELDSQKQISEQLRKDKERELSIQRQQLRMERDQALDFLKQRLIQEHIEELSSLSRAHMCNGGAEGGGVAASLRKQLRAKDLELRQVQRSMGQWKDQTAARLACKFEEELTAELERKTANTQEERKRKLEWPDREMTLSAKEAQNPVFSPSLCVAASHSASDVASFKLLRYLQSRVKQLRVENQANTWSPSPSNTVLLDLSGSYLTTISQGQDVAGIQSH